MIVESTRSGVRRWRTPLRGSLGLVPTMGFLHEGHLSLVNQARAGNDVVAASIFVNPTQFGPHEDLSTYPRDQERDLQLLEQAGVDLVFTPEPSEIYPPGFDTWVVPGQIADRLEGRSRPGHFRGVATVVLKLFNLFLPDRAYFGQKDAQQLRVIKQMVVDFDLDLTVIGMPTVREPDGLAMSSRNAYLDADGRLAALTLSRALKEVTALWQAGITDAARLRSAVTALFIVQPGATLEYISVADGLTLEELPAAIPGAVVSLAARVGKTRLIDTVTLPDQIDGPAL